MKLFRAPSLSVNVEAASKETSTEEETDKSLNGDAQTEWSRINGLDGLVFDTLTRQDESYDDEDKSIMSSPGSIGDDARRQD
jgi:hypothetical protein